MYTNLWHRFYQVYDFLNFPLDDQICTVHYMSDDIHNSQHIAWIWKFLDFDGFNFFLSYFIFNNLCICDQVRSVNSQFATLKLHFFTGPFSFWALNHLRPRESCSCLLQFWTLSLVNYSKLHKPIPSFKSRLSCLPFLT